MFNDSQAAGRRLKLLLVEDSRSIQEALAAALQDMAALEWSGVADTAADAIAAFSSDPPDVVILDLILRTGSGLEVLHAIKQRSQTCEVLIFTAHDAEASRVRCLAAGADHFFSKNRERWLLIQHLRLLAERPALPAGRFRLGRA